METKKQFKFGDSPRENAKVFFDLLMSDNIHLTAEDLQKIVPLSKPFLEEFSEIIKTEMSLATDDYKSALECLYKVTSLLRDASENNSLTDELKAKIFDQIIATPKIIKEMQHDHDVERRKMIRGSLFDVGVLGLVILGAFGICKKWGREDKKYYYPELGDFAPNGLRAINTSRRLRHCIGNR